MSSPPANTSHMPASRSRRPRNTPAQVNTKSGDKRYFAEVALHRATKGMPEGLIEAMSTFTEMTGSADLRNFIGALLDLNDPRLLDLAKDELVRKGVMKAGAFRDIRKYIEDERREKAKIAKAKELAKKGGIRVDQANFGTMLAYVQDILRKENDGPEPVLYVSGNRIVRLSRDMRTGRRAIEDMTKDSLVALLTRLGDWRMGQGDDDKAVRCPVDVALQFLHDPTLIETLPRLDAVVGAPFFAEDGSFVRAPGYDRKTGLFLAIPDGFDVPELPKVPTPEDVKKARLALADAFCDFPFSNASRESLLRGDASPDFANFLAWTMAPLIRPLIGPAALVPALYCGKSAYGVGSSKLLSAAQLIVSGESDLRPPLAKREDEQEKTIIATLASGRQYLVSDNCVNVSGAPIAALMTAPTFTGRILSKSETRSFANTLGVGFTGVNTAFSKECQRRIMLCWLSSDDANPQDRKAGDFVHPDLEAHIRQNRGRLFYSLALLIQNWIAKGRPIPRGGPTMGSYENFCAAASGILSEGGIFGFLWNKDRIAEKTGDVGDADDAAPAFVEAWLSPPALGPKPSRTGAKAKNLAELADAVELDLDVRQRPTELGGLGFDPREFAKWMGRVVGRVIVTEDGQRWRIVRSDPRAQGGASWSLELVSEAQAEPLRQRRGGRGRGAALAVVK